jgi:tetraacyldisaccharide 4'-kinase
MRGGNEGEGAAAVSRDSVRVIDRRTFSPVYEMTGLRKTLLAPIAYPLSAVYAAGIRAWRKWPARARDIGVPVLSVGSITVGGTGKTPLSMLIAGDLMQRGRRVAVVSRGYKRKRGASPLVVSDFGGVRAGVEEAGDEPYLMAVRLGGVAVVVDPDRVRGAEHARDSLAPDVILLDDGFQCRGLSKTVDIVTIGPDAVAPGAGYLPWGPLREGPGAIGREDIVVMVARSDAERKALAEGTARRRGLDDIRGTGRLHLASYVDPVIVDGEGRQVGPAAGMGRAVVVSGIARPEGFEATCDGLGVDAAVRIRFDDHHWYSGADTDMIERVMEEAGCGWLATTEKDYWRLTDALRARARAVRITLRVESADFLDRLAERIEHG